VTAAAVAVVLDAAAVAAVLDAVVAAVLGAAGAAVRVFWVLGVWVCRGCCCRWPCMLVSCIEGVLLCV
jgi:hypothetical protein